MIGITVAVRLGDGLHETVVGYRDLDRLQSVLLHPAFIEGSADYLDAYATEAGQLEGHGHCAPQDGGLIAIDLPGRRILAYEGYTNCVGACPARKVRNARDGIGPHPSKWETRAVWTTLMAEDRVKLRIRWHRRFLMPGSPEGAERVQGPFVMGVGPYPEPHERQLSYGQLPYSLEPLRDLDAAAARIEALEDYAGQGFGTPWRELEPILHGVFVDLAPWTVERFPSTRTGGERLRAWMSRLGFSGCAPGDPAWDEWAEDVRAGPRNGAHLARMRTMGRPAHPKPDARLHQVPKATVALPVRVVDTRGMASASPARSDPDLAMVSGGNPFGGWRPKGIAFDAFGTLVEIRDERRPYHRFTKLARSVPGITDPLVTDIAMAEWACSADAAPVELAEANADLAAEVASIALRDWVVPAWTHIRRSGIRIAVCSNLATPYGPPLMACLPEEPDVVVLSYKVGLKKPDPAIYALVAERLGLAPSDILFVGDTRSADYDGPRAAGMRALPVETFEMTWRQVLEGTATT
jgi:FMN phosphatase YigB (HAD superfamily)